jgi:hypothetical protein
MSGSFRGLAWGWVAALCAVAWLGQPSPAHAACDCPTASTAPYCRGSSISYPNKYGRSVSVDLGTPSGASDNVYTCGQYANGDFWIVGKGSPRSVLVQSTTPAVQGSGSGLRNGFTVNPRLNENRYDGRQLPPIQPQSLPRSFPTGPQPLSFVKSMSATSTKSATGMHPCQDFEADGAEIDARSCNQFTAIVTFVDAIPDSDSDGRTDDEFRPGFAGVVKQGPFRVDQISSRVASMPSLSPGPVQSAGVWSLQDVADRFRWPRIYHSDGSVDPMSQWQGQQSPRDNHRPSKCIQHISYGGNIICNDTAAILRVFLSDFDRTLPLGSTSRRAMVGIVQAGLDVQSAMLDGMRTAPSKMRIRAYGSIFVGKKILSLMAAWALDDPQLKNTVANTNWFFEDEVIYRSPGGIPVFGLPRSQPECASVPANNCQDPDKEPRSWCSPAAGELDRDSWCCSGGIQNYPSSNSNATPYQTLIVKLLRAESIWNDATFLEFGRGWMEGRGSVNRSTRYAYCGPSNNGGLTNTRVNNAQSNSFGDSMWHAYKNYVPNGTVPPPTPLPPPVQLD